jgi:hypothetical protein
MPTSFEVAREIVWALEREGLAICDIWPGYDRNEWREVDEPAKRLASVLERLGRLLASLGQPAPESYFDLCECGSIRGDHDDNLVCQLFRPTGKKVAKVVPQRDVRNDDSVHSPDSKEETDT